MMRKIILFSVLFQAVTGCGVGKNSMNVSEYSEWARSENYPYHSVTEVSKIGYDLRLYTTDLEVARAVSLKELEEDKIDEFRDSYKKTTTAILKISLPDTRSTIYNYPSDNEMGLSERAAYFSLGLTPAFKAVSRKGDTVQCSYAGIERGNSSYHQATANLEFPLSYEEIKTVIYDDEVLSESIVVFNFNKTDKKHSPKLKL